MKKHQNPKKVEGNMLLFQLTIFYIDLIKLKGD